MNDAIRIIAVTYGECDIEVGTYYDVVEQWLVEIESIDLDAQVVRMARRDYRWSVSFDDFAEDVRQGYLSKARNGDVMLGADAQGRPTFD